MTAGLDPQKLDVTAPLVAGVAPAVSVDGEEDRASYVLSHEPDGLSGEFVGAGAEATKRADRGRPAEDAESVAHASLSHTQDDMEDLMPSNIQREIANQNGRDRSGRGY